MKQLSPVLGALLLLSLSGCATTPPPQGKDGRPLQAHEYYTKARQAQAAGDYATALEQLDTLSRRAPASPYAALVPLERAYAHYQQGDHLRTIGAADQFIQQQPRSSALDYAWYLKGMAQLRISSDAAAFDHYSRAAYESLTQLVNGFPASRYRHEGLQQLAQLRNRMASRELEIIHTLLQQDETGEAAHRAQYLLEHYPGTPAASEAILIFKESAAGSSGTITPPALQERDGVPH